MWTAQLFFHEARIPVKPVESDMTNPLCVLKYKKWKAVVDDDIIVVDHPSGRRRP